MFDLLDRILREQEGEDSWVSESRRLIENNSRRCADHLRSIQNSIALITLIEGISQPPRHRDEDETILLGFGISLYNDCLTAWLLMMQGFCQMSFMPQRHMLECSIFLEYFSIERSAIQTWMRADRETRKSQLHVTLRNIKTRLEITEHPIEASYALLCDMNVHPTYKGVARMLGDQQSLLHPGPYVQFTNLQNGLTWLARISSYATKQLVMAYGEENLNAPFLLRRKDRRPFGLLSFRSVENAQSYVEPAGSGGVIEVVVTSEMCRGLIVQDILHSEL
jgi:hypothetical protein